jgi:RNA polymerase sigma-70 factor, ECF subfamily
VNPKIEQVFRAEWPRLVAALVRDLRDLELAEDCASEAFLAAADRWADGDVPDRPGAWLLTTARNRAIDRIRRAERHAGKLALLEATARSATGPATQRTLPDDQLALLLGCCHPALGIDAQVALTLRAVAGLSTAQIARAFLVPEPTMAKRLTRAKHKIRATRIPFTVPDPEHLAQRLPAVLHVIYLVFTQGHASSEATGLVRGDLCDEAVWLAELLAELRPAEPEVRGLAALILLTDARRETRLADDGSPLLLEEQDRSRWDRDRIERGRDHLRAAHEAGPIGVYGLQAAVAMVHAGAATFDETDWRAIAEIYDRLAELQDSPVVALNRAVAIAYLDGPDTALAEIDDLVGRPGMADYHYLHSARAELLHRLGRDDEAEVAYHLALATCPNEGERRLLARRLERLHPIGGGPNT